MTDEDVAKLMQEISEEIERLPESKDKPLNRKDRKRKLVLQARYQALERVKEARKKENFNNETRAALDYTLLTEYAEKNILWYNLMKARLWYWPRA
jgi:hypothetical protein